MAPPVTALVMCGGRGTRLDAAREKPLVTVGGAPMVDRVVAALLDSDVEAVHAVVSPHAPATAAHVAGHDAVSVIETPGEGYVADLTAAVERVGRPALTAAADLPLLAPDAVNRALAAVDDESSLTVCVPADRKRRLGASVDTAFDRDGRQLAPTGLNVVGRGDADGVVVSDDLRLAVNVNRWSDRVLADVLCRPRATPEHRSRR